MCFPPTSWSHNQRKEQLQIVRASRRNKVNPCKMKTVVIYHFQMINMLRPTGLFPEGKYWCKVANSKCHVVLHMLLVSSIRD